MATNLSLRDVTREPVVSPSGIRPTEFKVLIRPDAVEEKSKGGILLPDVTKERDQAAQQDGVIVAIAPLAFSYASAEEWQRAGGQPPQIGDRVSFARYAGAVRKGKDGVEYRLVNDKDISAILE